MKQQKKYLLVKQFLLFSTHLKAQLEQMEVVDAPTVKAAIKAVQKRNWRKGKNLFMPIRVAVSGQMHGSRIA